LTTYNPAVFDVNDMQRAMEIILTPEGRSTEERWRTETPYLGALVLENLALGPESVALDFGCGIGRMAQELIRRTGCRVVGVDISANMRALAPMYVQSERFMACSPEMLETLTAGGFRFDAAISVWVLQHCHEPARDIARIGGALKPGGVFFVVNNDGRVVPTVEHGWADDGLDMRELLGAERSLELREEGRLDPEVVGGQVSDASFWATYLRAKG
jgi:SAM-dependent methyltransferase